MSSSSRADTVNFSDVVDDDDDDDDEKDLDISYSDYSVRDYSKIDRFACHLYTKTYRLEVVYIDISMMDICYTKDIFAVSAIVHWLVLKI